MRKQADRPASEPQHQEPQSRLRDDLAFHPKPSRRRRKMWQFGAIALGAVIAVVVIDRSTARSPGAGQPPGPAQVQPQALPVQAGPVVRQNVPIFIEGLGTVQAFRSVLVRAQVNGYLQSINFTEGQTVKPGDLLAEIDPRPNAAALAQAQARSLDRPPHSLR